MDLQKFLSNKYRKDIALSELDGRCIELSTKSCGIVKGTCRYPGPIFDEHTQQIIDANIIVLKNVESENLLKTFGLSPKRLSAQLITFYPDDIEDISIL